jgi:proline iminopeptidase
VRLFFDVEGASLVPHGRTMREKPTLVLLHGGPGFDHSIYKPRFSALADIAQVVFLDHRGNGRSDPGPREAWTLAQWGDDVRAFCEVLGIARPIVLGVSFGGMVALAYATRHPAHPAKLILVSTEAAGGTYRERRVALFERFGGPEVGALARRRFLEGHTDEGTLGLAQLVQLETSRPLPTGRSVTALGRSGGPTARRSDTTRLNLLAAGPCSIDLVSRRRYTAELFCRSHSRRRA